MKNFYLGIDIGASRTRAVLLDGFLPQSVRPRIEPTPASLPELINLLCAIRADTVEILAGIGFSIAGAVASGADRILSAANMSFLDGLAAGVPLPKDQAAKRIDNDARCFIRAETRWGAAKDKNDLIGLVFGTGIGGAIWKDGEFFPGDDGLAGEFGHSILIDGVRWEEAARRAFREFGDAADIYAMGIAEVVRRHHPHAIVIGGGPIASGKYDLPNLREKVRENLGGEELSAEIVFGTLGDAAQAIGAALLFAD